MPENPLLPHRRLQELHALMLHCRELEKTNRSAAGLSREALLAAASIQLEPPDLLCGETADQTAALLSKFNKIKKPKPRRKAATVTDLPTAAPTVSHLTLCAGIARGLQAAESKGIVLALATTGVNTGWAEAFTYAQAARLPIVFIVTDTQASTISAGTISAGALTWDEAMKQSKRLKLPVLSVDGEDAVAVYRVVQESLLRARMGDGPALIWCALTRRRASTAPSKPLAHMEQYLAARKLKPLRASK